MSKKLKKTEFTIVDKTIANKATKSGLRGKKHADEAVEALRKLECGQAIQISLPKRSHHRGNFDRDRMRSKWGYRTRKVSKEEGGTKIFEVVTSDDGTSLFIQRIKNP